MDRRAAMFRMLHEAGASNGAIACAAGLSRGRVRQVCQDYAYQLQRIPFADAGIAAQSVIMAVGEQRVGDAIGFARRIEAWKQQAEGDLALKVKTGDAPARTVEIRRARIR